MDKLAHIIFVTNPFKPLEDTETCHVIGGKYTIRKWLKKKFKGFKEFDRPTICLYNGSPLLRRNWGRKIKAGDIINFVTVVGTPIIAFYVIVALVTVASLVVALNMKITPPNMTDGQQADPVYSLKGQQNQNRLGLPIEMPYGLNRIYPSYCAAPYNQYIDNEQWLFQLFCLGQGEYDVSAVQIGDTLTSDLQDVTYELVPPGSSVTLFPINVKVSTDVAGLELLGPNESALDGTNITDSVGDSGVGIASTSHPGHLTAGPYNANDANTLTNRIEVDLTLPNGCYVQNSDGTLGTVNVVAIVEARTIDNSGSPTSGWSTIITFTQTLGTVQPQRFTYSAPVTAARYQVRVTRTSNTNLATNAADKLVWEQMRAFIPDTSVDNGVTKLAVKARATNNLNDQSAQLINVIATRKIRIWDAGTSAMSLTNIATRSGVWALVDAFTSIYGGRLADTVLDLPSLVALDLVLAGRNEYFDWVFADKAAIWDIAKTIGACFRCIPMLNGSRITLVRDTVKSFPTAIFNQENIVKDSFEWQLKLAGNDTSDGLLVTYTDQTTWTQETVLCCMPGESGNSPDTITLSGIADRNHAYRTGMYLRRVKVELGENYIWNSGLEAHIPSYGDMVGVAHDVPEWNSGGMITSMVKTAAGGSNFTYKFNLTEPAVFVTGAYSLLVRKNDGSVAGPYTVTSVSGSAVITGAMLADADLDAIPFDNVAENPLYLFGPSSAVSQQVRVVALAPADDETVQITAVPYLADLFTEEDGTAPAIGDTHGSLPTVATAPDIDGLRVSRAPINQIDGGLWVQASWMPAIGAISYVLQWSYDTLVWSPPISTVGVSARLNVTARFLYVRVAAVAQGQGEWAYWAGNAPLTDTTTAGAPTSFTATNAPFVQPDGTAIPRVNLAWVASTDPLVIQAGYGGKYRIQYKKHADTAWIDWGTPDGSLLADSANDLVIGVSYDFRIRAENKFGGFSGWSTVATITVTGDTTVANAASSVVATAYPGYNEITWVRSSTVQVVMYQMYRNTSNTMSGATKIGEDDSNIFDDSGTVGGLTVGTTYYYFIVPVSGSNVTGTTSASANCTTLFAPSGAVPSAAGAPTFQSTGVYQGADATVMAYAVVRIQGIPAGAIWQNILLRVHGATSDWQIYNQNKNTTANLDVRLDELTAGQSYDLAMQAFNGAGGSAVVPLGATSFTAATKTALPTIPSGVTYIAGNSAGFLRAASMYSPGQIAFAVRINWNQSPDQDYAYSIIVLPSTDTTAAADAILAGGGSQPLYGTELIFTASTLPVQYFYIKHFNRSGVGSSWGGGGTVLNSVMGIPSGNMIQQNANAVAITGGTSVTSMEQTAQLKVAAVPAASSIREVLTHYAKGNDSVTLSGGSTTETHAISLSNRGFGATPNYGKIEVQDPAIGAYYDISNGSNSSTNAEVVFYRFDGGVIGAGTVGFGYCFDQIF